MKLKKEIFNHFVNSFGINTKRKLLLIESDDWGSIRMPSKKVYNSLIGSPIKVEDCAYSRYDSLETVKDFENLFNTLSSIKDYHDRTPIITSNFLVANPDFQRIRESNFSEYYYESLDQTYEKFNSGKVVSTIKNGIEQKYLNPQFHGREHLNIGMWMDLLKSNKIVQKAFDNNFFALSYANSNKIDKPYLAAFKEYYSKEGFNNIIDSGISMFHQIFGRNPDSFVAPVYIWDKKIEAHLSRRKFKSIQGLYYRYEYSNEKGSANKEFRFFQKKNEFGQVQLVRNCFFEPSTKANYDWIDKCLSEVKTAFMWKRPAIICTHRLNFMGSIDEKNQSRNLLAFEALLKQIIRNWPDVEFVTSSELTVV